MMIEIIGIDRCDIIVSIGIVIVIDIIIDCYY